MTHHHQNQTYDSPIEVLKPYLSYIAMFVGMGLISGSIVHAAQEGVFNRSMILMGIGIVLFSIGSFINELVFKTGHVEREGVLRYVLFSLFLAMGIGMISGSTQHFFDTPIYASYLMPIGVFVSSLAFALRNNYELTKITWVKLIVAGLAFAALLFAGLNTYAQSLPVNTGGHHGASAPNDGAHGASSEHGNAATQPHHTMPAVTSDENFLSGMIPHHQEAVDTSALILARTDNPSLSTFTQQVISGQAREISQMKQWYAQTTGRAYAPAPYMPMMGDASLLQTGTKQADVLYMQGMIAHHQGAVVMAQQILPITKNPNIKQMAQDIIAIQTQEIEQLKMWLSQSDAIAAPVDAKKHNGAHSNADGHHSK